MEAKPLGKLFVHVLKDLHSAERQLLQAIPKMAGAATNADLKTAFETHFLETKNQGKRLDSILKDLHSKPGGNKCAAMAGLIQECEEMCQAGADEHVRDAGLIACAQRIEHYEIATYGAAVALAEKLGRHEAAATLGITLEEERENESDLTILAENIFNSESLVAER